MTTTTMQREPEAMSPESGQSAWRAHTGQFDLGPLQDRFGVPFELGPKDLHDLPEFFGREGQPPPDFSSYTIEILAEINHVPQLSDAEIETTADSYRAGGADVIDLGCVPGESWPRAGEVTRRLRDRGLRVSIDGFDRREVEDAVNGGAELVLSCNGSNVSWACGLDAELVAIPDEPGNWDSLERTIGTLDRSGARFRVDPVLEPIGFGFAASLARYFEARKRWPDAEIMMGIGNLTELTEVDTAGINVLLAGICEELAIRSVLTTQVINWARSAVAELDFARRLVHHCLQKQVLPKHLDSRLVMLRDPKTRRHEPAELEQLAAQLKDVNFRIFVEGGEIRADMDVLCVRYGRLGTGLATQSARRPP